MYISNEKTIAVMSPNHAPCAFCASGDAITFQTMDCYSGNLKSEKDTCKRVASRDINPATGPVYVEGAEPGDILKVEIKKINIDEQACIRISPDCGPLGARIKERGLKILKVQDGFVYFNESIKLPVSPMIGVIGVAPGAKELPCSGLSRKTCVNGCSAGLPDEKAAKTCEKGKNAGCPGGIHNGMPGEHGSNMDCTKIQEGTTLYLPVNVPGALLAMGDLHAVMGDGEVAGCAAEISGEVTVRVTVLKEKMPTPLLQTKDAYITIASARTIDEAGKLAAEKMEKFLEQATGMTSEDCVMLLSLAGNMEICQVVNPLKTARMTVPRWIIDQCKGLDR